MQFTTLGPITKHFYYNHTRTNSMKMHLSHVLLLLCSHTF